MKKQMKRILANSPTAYALTKRALDSVRGMFGTSAENIKRVKRNISILKQAREVLRSLGLSGVEITEKEIILQVKDGLRFYFDPDQVNSLLSIPMEGYFEPNETAFMKSRISPGDVVVDVGANFGWYTTHFSKWVGHEGRVHAFEPLTEAFLELGRNVSLNQCGHNSSLVNKAIGKENGEIKLYLPEDLGTAFASQHNYYGKEQTVEVATLDSYANENKLGKIDFIKADVEGGELQVLFGAENILDDQHPDLFLEIQEVHAERFGYHAVDVFEFLKNKGYSAFYLGNNGLLEQLRDFTNLPTYNFYFSSNAQGVRD